MWMNRNGLLTTGVKWEEYRQVTSLGCARSLGQLWASIGRRGGGNGSDRIGLFFLIMLKKNRIGLANYEILSYPTNEPKLPFKGVYSDFMPFT